MVLDQNMKDNLTLMGNRNNPSYLMPLLVLLAGAIVAFIIVYTYSPHKHRLKTTEADTRKKPAVTAKMEQRMLGAVKSLIASNEIILARQQCYELLQNTANSSAVSEAEKMLGQINVNLLLSPAPMPEKTGRHRQNGTTDAQCR